MKTTPADTSSSRAAWSATDLDGNPHESAEKAGRVRAMFAGIAGSYDINNRLHSLWRDQAWRRRVVRLAELTPTDEVLDVACGTGDLTEAFAAAGPARVVGVDFTKPMLDIARAKTARRRRPGSRCVPEYETGDALALRFDDASFDVVSIAFGIRNVADPAAALAEFRRVLRPGGRLTILEFSEPANPILRAMSRLYTKRIMPVTATLVARDRTGAYRYLPKSVETFLDRDALVAAMTEAGFADVTVHPMTTGICVGYIGRRPHGSGGPQEGPTRA